MKIINKLVLAFALLFVGSNTDAFAACPDTQLTGEKFTLTKSRLKYGLDLRILAGGDTRLDYCPDLADIGAIGLVVKKPDFEVNLVNPGKKPISFRVSGQCDTVLLVKPADGNWEFSDDSVDGKNPRITVQNPSAGSYHVWVGTFERKLCGAVLSIDAVDAAAVVVARHI